MTTSITTNKILFHVEQLYRKLIDGGANEALNTDERRWKILEKYFQMDRTQLVIFIPILCRKLLGKRGPDIEELQKLLQYPISKIDRIHLTIKQLIAKGLISRISPDFDEDDCYSFSVKRPVMNKVLQQEPFEAEVVREKSIEGFLESIFSSFDALEQEELRKGVLVCQVEDAFLSPLFQEVEEVSKIRNLPLTQEQRAMLCYIYFTSLQSNSESINLDEVISKLQFKAHTRKSICADVYAGEHPFIKHELIDFRGSGGFKTTEYMKWGRSSYEIFGKKVDTRVTLEKGTLILPENITTKKMFYNEREKKEINQLYHSLSDENYNSLINRYRDKGMPQNMIVCLHGKPGTGKTETCYQMAKQTGRAVFRIDVDQIRDQYVGESEKNLRRMFSEYRNLRKTSKKCPILLFNECDSLIRGKVKESHGTDQMANNMINILLEEVELLEGILVCTTNDIAHFEEAFYRRLLFVIQLDPPASHIVEQLILGKFSEYQISTDTAKTIADSYSLTGAQLDNIQRKMIARMASDSSIEAESMIIEMAKDELGKQVKTQRVVVKGFCR